MMQRIREGFDAGDGLPFPSPVDVDKTYMGGKEKNNHGKKKQRAGRATAGKTAVASAKDRASKEISAAVVAKTDRESL